MLKYVATQQTIKQYYKDFKVAYNGTDNNDYVNGSGFCCDDTTKTTKNKNLDPKENDNPELYQYYYHSDHLGSSSYITNLDGEVAQHIEYVPFGEVFLEEKNDRWNTPYLFNGKELDEETGLYYYGARYYDSRVSLWLSVDPLAEKYVSLSAYNYTANNPIKYIDPDGQILGRIRSWFGHLFFGGARTQNKYGDWVVINRQQGKAKNYGGSLFRGINTPLQAKITVGKLKFDGFFNTVANYNVSRIGHLIPKTISKQERAYKISGHADSDGVEVDPIDIFSGVGAVLKVVSRKIVTKYATKVTNREVRKAFEILNPQKQCFDYTENLNLGKAFNSQKGASNTYNWSSLYPEDAFVGRGSRLEFRQIKGFDIYFSNASKKNKIILGGSTMAVFAKGMYDNINKNKNK